MDGIVIVPVERFVEGCILNAVRLISVSGFPCFLAARCVSAGRLLVFLHCLGSGGSGRGGIKQSNSDAFRIGGFLVLRYALEEQTSYREIATSLGSSQ